MKVLKKVLLATFMIACASYVFAEEETSVENEYLNDIDGEIISTLAESDDYENKLVALEYLRNALSDGNNSEAVVAGLDRLAGEGINSQTREKGRLTNNFPDIRREACLLMGNVKTEHSKNMLVQIAVADAEPMVIAAAVKSLGNIGINDNDEVVEAIAFANRRNQVLNPTSSLAMEVLDALEKLSSNTENKKTIIDTCSRISTDYHYVTPVRQRAYKLLKQMSSSGNSDDNKKSKDSSKKNEDEVETVDGQ
ncbi:MAG: HEAT repeat domain-containing protein [Treponema sp.]|nr:HEAT repeat domain-containing protein [Treponema sp.]